MSGRIKTAVWLVTRDLRIHDNPALASAAQDAEHVVPLFVAHPALQATPNRQRFLLESLADLRASLRRLGGDLVVRRGDPVTEAVKLARELNAGALYVAGDASRYAHQREERLRKDCEQHRIELHVTPGVTVVPPGGILPTGGDGHYKVFTPYWRAWQNKRKRPVMPPPRHLTLPTGVSGGDPADVLHVPKDASADVVAGGETAGRQRLTGWARSHAEDYDEHHDDMAGDLTSRLSAYLHFGCLSPREVADRLSGTEAFVRQLCWRDFYHQVLAAFPDLSAQKYRAGAVEQWGEDKDALQAWQHGQTGVPVVDAGMRQLAEQGWMHNRARLITAGFLTKKLGLDWRDGLAHFHHLLVDADVANNSGNWQWVAGTGNDARPYRGFNPIRQALRFDPDGTYVRRWVGELAGIEGAAVHEPWKLDRTPARYPEPIGIDTTK